MSNKTLNNDEIERIWNAALGLHVGGWGEGAFAGTVEATKKAYLDLRETPAEVGEDEPTSDS